MDSLTFLADPTSPGTKRTALLRLDGWPHTVRTTVMHIDREPVLLFRVWLGGVIGYVYVLVDRWSRVLAEATGTKDEDVDPLIRERLAAKGVHLDAEGKEYSLLADHVENGRRTSVLRSDEDTIRVRARLWFDEDGDDELVHVRAEFSEFGFIHLVIDQEAALVAKATGKTDGDAWERIRGELGRMEYSQV